MWEGALWMVESDQGNQVREKVAGLRKELESMWTHYETPDALHASARRALEDELMPEEVVRVVIPGMANSAIIGTDRRLFVLKTGFRPDGSAARAVSNWDYGSIAEVEFEAGPMSAAVVVRTDTDPASDASSASTDAWNAPNAIAVNRARFQLARQGVALLQTLAASVRRS